MNSSALSGGSGHPPLFGGSGAIRVSGHAIDINNGLAKMDGQASTREEVSSHGKG